MSFAFEEGTGCRPPESMRSMEMMMSRLFPVSLVALLATCAAATSAFAGVPAAVPEPSSLALLAGGLGIVYLTRKLRRGK